MWAYVSVCETIRVLVWCVRCNLYAVKACVRLIESCVDVIRQRNNNSKSYFLVQQIHQSSTCIIELNKLDDNVYGKYGICLQKILIELQNLKSNHTIYFQIKNTFTEILMVRIFRLSSDLTTGL